MSCTTSPGSRRGRANTPMDAITSEEIAIKSRFRTYWRMSLRPVEPQRGGAVAVVEAGVRRVVLHIGLPGPGDADVVETDVVLLLGHVALDVEDELPARLHVLDAHLLLQHAVKPGIVDVARVAGLLGHVHTVEDDVGVPGDAEGAHGDALELPQCRRRRVGAELLEPELGVDATLLELALSQLHGV